MALIKYAGIGSRQTPQEIRQIMGLFAWAFADKTILRSGGAKGADGAFIGPAITNNGEYEVYLPWRGYSNWPANLHEPKDEAFEIAAQYHPTWKRLKRGARLLHARNAHIILGENLNDPVEFVVCWTKDGKASGGTGQAIRHADDLKILVLNLHDDETRTEICQIIDDAMGTNNFDTNRA